MEMTEQKYKKFLWNLLSNELDKTVASFSKMYKDCPFSKTYISGKISGLYELEARENFKFVENLIRICGGNPVNPMNRGEAGLKWSDYMREDLKLLADCNFIVFMKNYEDSKGAKLEEYIANELEITTIYL